METARHRICIDHVILIGQGQEFDLHLPLQCSSEFATTEKLNSTAFVSVRMVIVQNAVSLGKRHDNQILKCKFYIVRSLAVIAQASSARGQGVRIYVSVFVVSVLLCLPRVGGRANLAGRACASLT